MCERAVESDPRAAVVRIFGFDGAKGVLESVFAAAEDDRLRAGANHCAEDGREKLKALLIDESRHDGEQRRLRFEFQSQLAQQCALRKRLSVQSIA